jgi:general secretion pathway protein I
MSVRSQQGGFTLIEVVVAFAILALSLGALYESFGGSLRRSAAASKRELAALRAESLLAEFRGSDGHAPAPRSGRDKNEGMEWRIVSKPYPAEIADNSAWVAEAVLVEVSWGDAENRRVKLESVELLRRESQR